MRGALPCWIGEDPDGGACDAFNAYHFTTGAIRDVEVSGLSIVNVVRVPGNVLTPNSWKVITFLDERATHSQLEAIVDAYHGRLGGPFADLPGLFGEILAPPRPGSPRSRCWPSTTTSSASTGWCPDCFSPRWWPRRSLSGGPASADRAPWED